MVWEGDPRGFNLEAWRSQAPVPNGLSRDMILADENGIIRQSSVAEAVNQNVSGLDYLGALVNPSDLGNQTYNGAATIDGIMRQWNTNVARPLHHPDGSLMSLARSTLGPAC